MNVQSRLDEFRADNPFDIETQAKRLLAGEDKELLFYVVVMGLATAKQRQRHYERSFIKNVGEAPEKERLVPRPGGVAGSVVSIKITPSQRARNAARQVIGEVWRINGEQKLNDANYHDLTTAIKREEASAKGHSKNSELYGLLREKLNPDGSDKVREKINEKMQRATIKQVYGEFRKSEAA